MKKTGFLFVLAALAIALAVPCASAQYSADKPLGASAQNAPAYLKNAGISQELNHPLPLADEFTDATGQKTPLGAYFGRRPVMLALVYYNCGMLCPQVLHGMASALSQTGFHAGKEYDVVVASINPDDKTSDAAEAKQQFLKTLGQPDAGKYVHFLIGPQKSINDLSAATGFHYVRVPGPDGKMDQFAHSSVIMIATPDGRMSKYLSGIDYQSRDVRLALIQASNHKIGSFSDMVLLYCCNYTPSQGRYTVAVLRILSIAAMASLLALGGIFYLLSRKPKTRAS